MVAQHLEIVGRLQEAHSIQCLSLGARTAYLDSIAGDPWQFYSRRDGTSRRAHRSCSKMYHPIGLNGFLDFAMFLHKLPRSIIVIAHMYTPYAYLLSHYKMYDIDEAGLNLPTSLQRSEPLKYTLKQFDSNLRLEDPALLGTGVLHNTLGEPAGWEDMKYKIETMCVNTYRAISCSALSTASEPWQILRPTARA